MPLRSREIRLAARPRGMPTPDDFELAEVEVPDPGEGEVLVRNAYVSVDPYMRGRMNDVRSYVPPFALGEPLTGGAVGRIVASRSSRWPEGSWVVHDLGWREAAVVEEKRLRAVDPPAAPVSTALGVLGMPGLTAFVGIDEIGGVKEGDTVFVSGAAGAVGSLACQLARHRGARVIASAGSAEKRAWLAELGVESTFDYHETSPRDALRELAPDGIDVYFDNVGGETLEAAIGAMRLHGRIVACGSIAGYNATEPPPGPRNMFLIVTKRLRIQGFIIRDHGDRWEAFVAEVAPLVADGTIGYRETVVDGIERAPEAFLSLFAGDNVGKMLVRVGPEP
ncbi:NADP-dependent oxidoreductase [Gaiella sp.]|uniref:NADP-dependent oxidoreductase n=1 Tax=Gaiella sp. TaxID=2663207 RepID=UPI002E358269|nr:NADP-dependent oxidoreductase [Gaiella sp.]HEX5584526.1 NADP-dependent oxidoreductase [Gaiella sp.]